MQVDWKNHVGSGSQEREFMECLRESFLEQLVVDFLCNEADLINELKVKDPLGSSDHNIIEFGLQFERGEVESDVMVLQLNKGNYRGMMEELMRIDWKQSRAGKTVEQQWQEFLGLIQVTQRKFIPKKRKHIIGRMRQPWLTREVRDCIKTKEKVYNVAKSSGKSGLGRLQKQTEGNKEIRRE